MDETREQAAAPPAILVNREAGTVRSMGEEAVRSLITEVFGSAADILMVPGAGIEDAIRQLKDVRHARRIIVGGGDGTVASVASLLAGSDVAMGILPFGTMNLMANALGISADPRLALAQLRTAVPRPVDAARAGDRLFLHHVSFGIQPRMVRIRERLGYTSRLTKMLAGLRALLSVLVKPQSQRLSLVADGRRQDIKAPAFIVSNNIYENSAWLKQERLDGGILGLYALKPMSRPAFLRLALDLLRGRWRDNLNVSEDQARAVTIITSRRRFGRPKQNIWATIDGELSLLGLPLTIASAPAALQMLVPAAEV